MEKLYSVREEVKCGRARRINKAIVLAKSIEEAKEKYVSHEKSVCGESRTFGFIRVSELDTEVYDYSR